MVEIDDLETRSFESPALSLYLTLVGGAEPPERFLGPLLAELSGSGGDEGDRELADALCNEIETAERELADRPPARAVALFSCRPAGMLEVFELPEEVPPMMVFGDHLETWPLREQVGRHPGGVIHRRHEVLAGAGATS